MTDILQKICEVKRKEVEARKNKVSLSKVISLAEKGPCPETLLEP